MSQIRHFPDLNELKNRYIKSESILIKGKRLVENEMCTLTSHSDEIYHFLVEDRFADFQVEVQHGADKIETRCSCISLLECCTHSAAALISLQNHLRLQEAPPSSEGEAYTRKEMMIRVLRERKDKADKEDMKLEFGDSVYGFHTVKTASGRSYQITIRDVETEDGYCSCPDFKTNKLGSCKHLMFAIDRLKQTTPVDKLNAVQRYPFVEIYCDPHNDYQITGYHQNSLTVEIENLLNKYFHGERYILPEQYKDFLSFLSEAQNHKAILIRPEVNEKIDKHFEKQFMKNLSADVSPDFSVIKAKMFDYQKEGVFFSLFKAGNIIADEMGLGKTLQAMAVALLKKDIYDLKRTLIICPASLKYQWKKEIERFSGEQAVIVEGGRKERQAIYRNSPAYFFIANYEAVMRDVTSICKYPPDMIILDEAQRIKNYDTKTSHAVKSIPKKHALVITGTPLENRLLDLYSIMNFIDPTILAPQWEFSMNHCYFDKAAKNKITGYFNLQQLKTRLNDYIIRREKSDVFEQLPAVQEINVPVQLHPEQQDIHAGLARSLAPIIAKKHKTIYDMQRIQQILTQMRMVCDSTYLIDRETNISPKLEELQEILFEKLDIKQKRKKVIIFTEWTTMQQLISKQLRANQVQHVLLSGEIPVQKRGHLIDEFANNPECLVFISTEAGGVGLNLQFADTVINFDLPWNPAKKNQRIGRINRIGQQSSHITAINLVAINSIESRIADGIVLKEALFDAVLNEGDLTDEVDFSVKGRSTFIEQLQKLIQFSEEAQDTEEAAESGQIQPQIMDEKTDEAVETTALAEEEEYEPVLTGVGESQPVSPPQPQEIENTLNQGLQFLSGIFKMATGKELLAEGAGVSFNRETGEVSLKFKLPGF